MDKEIKKHSDILEESPENTKTEYLLLKEVSEDFAANKEKQLEIDNNENDGKIDSLFIDNNFEWLLDIDEELSEDMAKEFCLFDKREMDAEVVIETNEKGILDNNEIEGLEVNKRKYSEVNKEELDDKDEKNAQPLESEALENKEGVKNLPFNGLEQITTGKKSTYNKNFKPKSALKRIIILLSVTIITLMVFYFGATMYFLSRFLFGTIVNGIDISGQKLNDAETMILKKTASYVLKIKERAGKIEEIKGSDINIEIAIDDKLKELMDTQNTFRWVYPILTKSKDSIELEVIYDKELLLNNIESLLCLKSENIIEPSNPIFIYDNFNYTVLEEVMGNKIDKDKLIKVIEQAVKSLNTEIDLEVLGCYINPKYSKNSQKTIDTLEKLNKYVSTKITYIHGDRSISVDGNVINGFLMVNENLDIIIDEDKVNEYINELSKKINTVGKSRRFTTTLGKIITVSGGDYGWSIDKKAEANNLISAIKDGITDTAQPIFKQTALFSGPNDIGDTYVEIDLTNQHIWYYKNGKLIIDGNIVSGNLKNDNATPKGVYSLKRKSTNVVLRGPDYAVPVKYWMPFNGGIGIHDAEWRKKFGGDIYRTNGSRGCINTPLNVSKAIYENIEVGTPIVCYY